MGETTLVVQPSAGRCMHSIPLWHFNGQKSFVALHIIVEGPKVVPPLWMLRLVEGKIEPALVVPACNL